MDLRPLTTCVEREIALWDQRKLDGGATARVIVDHQSGPLTPFYDDGTGVLYVGGNLVIGKRDFTEVESVFLEMGYDRVLPATGAPPAAT